MDCDLGGVEQNHSPSKRLRRKGKLKAALENRRETGLETVAAAGAACIGSASPNRF